MKTLKISILSGILAMGLLVSCTNAKSEEKKEVADKDVPVKESVLEMNKDTLNAHVNAEIEKEIVKRKINLTKEALATLGDTRSILDDIDKGKKDQALKKSKELIGQLEILLAKDPELAFIPVDVNYQRNELVADIETVRKLAKEAEKAMDKGYYREAADILDNIRSEMVINTYLIPTVTYPEAIKRAAILLEQGNSDAAKAVLIDVFNFVVTEKTVIPLPVLNAEQMLIEAADIDAKDHENVDKVLNLLQNADYQLQLAEEMGYGKKDKDFKLLAESIKELKKSVKNKENSESKFDSIKKDIRRFIKKITPESSKRNK